VREVVVKTGKTVADIATCPDGRLLAVATLDVAIRVFDLERLEIVSEIPSRVGHSNFIQSLAWSSDGQTLASCAIDGEVRLWHAPTWQCRKIISGFGQVPTSLAFVRDSSRLFVGVSGIAVVDAREGVIERVIARPERSRVCIATDSTGSYVYSASSDGRLRRWSAATHAGRLTLPIESMPMYDIAVDPTRNLVYAPTAQRTIAVFDALAGTRVAEFGGLSSLPTAIELSPDNSLVSVSDRRGDVSVYETTGWSRVSPEPTDVTENHAVASELAISADNRHCILVTEGSAVVKSVEWKTGRILHEDRGEQGTYLGMNVSDDGTRAFVGGSTRLNAILSLPELTKISDLVSAGVPRCAAFRPGSSTELAVGGSLGALVIHDVSTGRPLRHFEGHSESVFAVAYSPDGALLASSAGTQVYLWSADAGTPVTEPGRSPWRGAGQWGGTLARIDLAPMEARDIEFCDAGRRIAVATSTGTVLLIDLQHYGSHIAGNLQWQLHLLGAGLPVSPRQQQLATQAQREVEAMLAAERAAESSPRTGDTLAP
jgi:WD40 repeat protein